MEKDIPITLEEMQSYEILTLRKQVEQLQSDTQTVSKIEHDRVLDALEQMRTNFINSQTELKKMRDSYDTMERMYLQASDQVKEQTEESTQAVIIKDLKSKLSRPTAGAPRKTDKTDADIIAMRASGLTIRQICDSVKKSPTTIVKILKNANVNV